MTSRPAFFSVMLAASLAAAQDAPQPSPAAGSEESIRGGDERLLGTVRAVAERIAGIVQVPPNGSVIAVRADEPTRAAESGARARNLLPPGVADARGRAWRDLGLGSGSEPGALVAAIERDLPGMTFDAAGKRLLVDPQCLQDGVVRGDPDVDADASVMLATGVAPDEPVAGHYIAHALLDGPALQGPVTTDRLLARAALAEGSANLAALVLLFGGVGLESEVLAGSLHPEDALGGRLVPATLRLESPVVASLMEFAYLDGFAQAAALAKKGGFRRLAQERMRRLTTRDVIHLDRPAAPLVAIPEPPLSPALGLTAVDRDTLGEQGIITLVSLATGKDNLGLIAGDGWAGDTLWRFEPSPQSGAQGDDGATVWVTVWNSEDDAKDFVYVMERCLQARFPGGSIQDDEQRGGRVLRRIDRVYRVEKTGTQVVVRVVPPGIDLKSGPQSKKESPVRQQNKPKK